MRSPRFFLLAAGVVGLLEANASAQTLPSIDARTWRPSSDPGASLVLEPVTTPGSGNWNVGAWVSYANRPITLRSTGTSEVAFRPVEHLVGADLTAQIGLGSRAALGLSLPTFLYQDGSSPLPASVASTGVPTSGIGDVALHGKANLVANDSGGFGLATLAAVTLPTGDRASFMGDGSMTATARVLAEYSLVIAALQASVGYTLHTDHHTWPAASAGGFTFGDQIPWTLGLRMKPGIFRSLDSGDRQVWELAAHGSLPAGPVGPFGSGDPGSAQLSPVLLAASDRIALGHYKDAFFLAGVDVGLTTAVGVPTVRGIVALGWAPRDHDMDHDGVPDDLDQCPEIPEDIDGFEDSDGCPDIDDDDDGIIDKEDACPLVPGVPSDDKTKNGCPAVDTDGDGIPDAVDACPREKGAPSSDPKRNGCASRDRDGDGIPDDLDKCPDQPEDKDGFEDEDGCPDPDNDGDGISDKVDACPTVPGEPSTDPKRNGCPNPDRDGDSFENDKDQCPDAAEVFNGVKDEDGCPDEGGKPLVVVDEKTPSVRLASPIKFTAVVTADGQEIDPASVMTLRALALELNRHRDWTLAVGARDKGTDAVAMKAAGVVHALLLFTHREGAAEVVAWDTVKATAGESGLGMRVMVTPLSPKAAPPAQLVPER